MGGVPYEEEDTKVKVEGRKQGRPRSRSMDCEQEDVAERQLRKSRKPTVKDEKPFPILATLF